MSDRDYLKMALEESKKVKGAHKFGAVVVLDGKVIAKDHNHVWETSDPSAHAEVSALRAACKKLGSHNIAGATLYASHEPCMMCLCCAAWAGVSRIVYGHKADELTGDMYEFKGAKFKEVAAKLNRDIEVEFMSLSEKKDG